MHCYPVFCLEKFLPTHCPSCGHHFGSNQGGDFSLDLRLFGRGDGGIEYAAAFNDAAEQAGLKADQVVCGQCRNVTCRVITATRTVRTEAEARRLEAQGFVNRTVGEWRGSKHFDHPDYQLQARRLAILRSSR